MRKFLTFLSIGIFCLSIATKLDAQVITEIDSVSRCYGDSVSYLPVVVQNMNAVDSLRLVLTFNGHVINLREGFNINPALNGNKFSIDEYSDSIVIKWHSPIPATIAHDTLVNLRFWHYTGATKLLWNHASSFYHSSSGNLSAVFVDGAVTVDSKITVTLTEIDPTCAAKCDANYMAKASGGIAPYTYLWDKKPAKWDTIKTNICAGAMLVSIIDSRGCRIDSNYHVKGLPGANVKLIIEGNEDTTVYIQNPVLKFSFQEVSPTHVVQPPLWEFGDGDTATAFSVVHIFSRANGVTGNNPHYDLKLHVTNENGCDSLIEVTIPIKDAKVKPITGVMTPNGDGKNDAFLILNHNKTGSGDQIKVTNEFQRMDLMVFDRWGRKIYSNSDYRNDWGASGVPDGSYYYVLKTIGFYSTDVYKGSITILGGKN